ncbi:rod shape-determining protein MreD [Pollutimonas sp. M17]|uniref:rod shape-determining protein MreD n=1 Tax=Pollutimonas sp. M17 TaxID=2962065 RepID=UPI0021F4145F|nr:rod shape-determining protein MreD [Pollutimonas sp. M17]UYO94233.1 rod shape-determining protein MreD [Pollutimonas sp. M17]HWK71240.1 rod shape-determining protein MreD [Burkholderiaceae bacterium]
MPRKPDNSVPMAGLGRSGLSSLQPIDTSPFKKPSSLLFIWATVLLVWLISLLPWRLWQPAPDLLLLVIAFWCLNEPQRVTMLAAFVFGLFMDVHDAALLGGQALTFTLTAYGAIVLRRRLLRFNAIVQAIHLLPIFVVANAITQFICAWLSGQWAGWGWLWSSLFTVALWPLADILLHLPQRRLDEADAGSV